MNDTKPKPALTPEEWAKLRRAGTYGDLIVHEDGDHEAWYPNGLALAAYLLQTAGPDGKPLFTREMVALLREAANRVADHELAHEAVDRLESLLPPE